MKLGTYYTLILAIGLMLSAGCTSQLSRNHSKDAKNNQQTKDLTTVNLINHPKDPKGKYSIIGIATVSKYNTAGIKRQKAIIKDRLRELAASMGGNAIIHLKSKGKYVTGTIIATDRT